MMLDDEPRTYFGSRSNKSTSINSPSKVKNLKAYIFAMLEYTFLNKNHQSHIVNKCKAPQKSPSKYLS
jgi:hypothetical protein